MMSSATPKVLPALTGVVAYALQSQGSPCLAVPMICPAQYIAKLRP